MRIALACLALALALRHDVEESDYVNLGRQFAAVCSVNGLGTGTLVAPRWVLTAAHVPEMIQGMRPMDRLRVTFGDQVYPVREVVVPALRKTEPGRHDIALLRLEKPVPDIAPMELYADDDELGAEVVLVGTGILARGDAGVKLSREAMDAPTRRLRAGRNQIDRIDEKDELLFATFDPPEEGLDLEAAPCLGDSGGPVLTSAEGEPGWQIAGVIAQDDGDGDRIVGEYGETFGMTRVSAYVTWVEETIEE